MTYQVYHVVLCLRSPMHIGQVKLGNVQRTRPYVTGRVLWGALTLRLTRNDASGPATDSQLYRCMGEQVHDQLAFTYFYPTIHTDGSVDLWPWGEDEGKAFRARFLSTYASTALTYPQQSADEGTLHEVECIVPNTVDGGKPVYLAGYVFAQNGAPKWQPALERLQLGGERGYGWGRVKPLKDPEPWDKKPLFDGQYTVEPDGWPPVLKSEDGARLLAHTLAADFETRTTVTKIDGEVEPLVGREAHPEDGRFAVWLSQDRVYYAPGGKVNPGAHFCLGPYGLWEGI